MPESGVVAPVQPCRSARTGLSYDERCLLHDNGSMLVDPRVRQWLDVPHAEGRERLSRTYALLEHSRVLERLERVPPRKATEDELRIVHTPEHIASIRTASARGGLGTKALADELCDGRVVAFQEGGYSLDHTPLCNLAIIEALAVSRRSGRQTRLKPTFL